MRTKWIALLMAAVIVVPGLARAQTEWVDYPDNPVVPVPDSDDWDADRLGVDVIVVDGTYHMFFMGRNGGAGLGDEFDIGHATSADGISWEMDPANPVLTRGSVGEWDDNTAGSPAVLHDETGFRMWYAGCDQDELCGVGYATSPDGSTWTKYAENPVALPGPPGSFDDADVWPGTVLFDGGLYRMWYTGARDAAFFDWRIGYAESSDGISWTGHPEPVINPDQEYDAWLAYDPKVVRDGSVYRMWYAAASGVSSAGIAYADSPDGIHWTKYIGNRVVEPGTFFTDFHAVVLDEASGTYRMWYVNLSDSSYHLATSQCCTMTHPDFIAAAALASGAQGSFYQTDLDLNNASGSAVEYELWWLPRGESNSDPMTSETFTLGAGMSVRYTNVLAEVFGLEPNSLGALMVMGSSPELLVMSRTYNLATAKAEGTFGQSMPAVGPEDFIGQGERRRILFGSQGEAYRTNIGCINGNDMTIAVDVELFDAQGALLTSERLRLDAWSNDQLNAPFSDYAPVNGYAVVSTPLPSGSFYCYGSVLDNQTSDPTTIPPM